MGILIRVAIATALGVTGCYDPTLQDCTITCAAPDECGDGQVCGADNFCAAPGVAGTCAPVITGAMLKIRIEKKGRVVLDNPAFTCESTDDDTMCTTAVPRIGGVDLHAVETDKEFERWTTLRCGGQPSTCHLLLGDDVIEVGVKFK